MSHFVVSLSYCTGGANSIFKWASFQINQDSDIKSNLTVGGDDGDHLTTVKSRLRGFVTAGLKGLVYFFDPPDQQSKKK